MSKETNMSKEIESYIGFEDDSLIIPFEKIISFYCTEVDPSDLPDEFETHEKTFKIIFKQENTESNSEAFVSEEVLSEFKSKYKKYLDYRMQEASNKNEVLATHMEETKELFESLSEQVNKTLSSVVDMAESKMISIVDESRKVLDDNRDYNKTVEKNLYDLEKLQELIKNFIVDVDNETLEGQLVEDKTE